MVYDSIVSYSIVYWMISQSWRPTAHPTLYDVFVHYPIYTHPFASLPMSVHSLIRCMLMARTLYMPLHLHPVYPRAPQRATVPPLAPPPGMRPKVQLASEKNIDQVPGMFCSDGFGQAGHMKYVYIYIYTHYVYICIYIYI